MIQLWQSEFWMWKSHMIILAGKGWLMVCGKVNHLGARETASGDKETMFPESNSQSLTVCMSKYFFMKVLKQFLPDTSVNSGNSWNLIA